MIDEADRDGDGEVNEEKFLRMMKKMTIAQPRLYLLRHQRFASNELGLVVKRDLNDRTVRNKSIFRKFVDPVFRGP